MAFLSKKYVRSLVIKDGDFTGDYEVDFLVLTTFGKFDVARRVVENDGTTVRLGYFSHPALSESGIDRVPAVVYKDDFVFLPRDWEENYLDMSDLDSVENERWESLCGPGMITNQLPRLFCSPCGNCPWNKTNC
jgi:hypothetical protein